MFKFQPLIFAMLLSQAGAAFRGQSERQLSEELFLNYEPLTTVTDHAAIDLDQKVLEEELAAGTDEGKENAENVYRNGGHSKSYATVTLDAALDSAVPAGTEVIGQNENGDEIRGTVMSAAAAGANTLEVQYATTDRQETYVNCQVGGLPDPNLQGCLSATGTLKVGVTNDISYSYNPETDNDNARTLQGFSLQAQEKMNDCEFCPYPTAKKFFDYYGDYDYGDKWVTAAFNGGSTGFSSGNGNADFSSYGQVGMTESVKKGTAYLNVWMYTNRELEDAIDDCNNDCDTEECNDDQVHAWDEAVAFYTGSVPKTSGDGGYLLYTLAQKRCANFNTCMKSGDQAGMAGVNTEIFRLFVAGKQQLQTGQCDAAKTTVEEITKLMTVPMVQGTLRYAHIKDKQNQAGEKQEAEGAIFAAAVLPILHECDAGDAQLVYENMRVGSGSNTDFEVVKAAFERRYDCMGITCAHVGGLLQADGETYFEGAEPCGNGQTVATQAAGVSGAAAYGVSLAIGLAAGVLALLA